MYATGLVAVMLAGAVTGPASTTAAAVPEKNRRDLLFTSKYFSYSDDHDDHVSGGGDHGYVGQVYDHFSKFSGYDDDKEHEDEPKDPSESPYVTKYGSTRSVSTCSSYASAHAFEKGIHAHTDFTKYAIMEFCKPSWGGKIKHVHDTAKKHAAAVAKAVTESQADCVSKGNAFGCASATATAEAWAESKAEAHVAAVASAYDECEKRWGCPVNAGSLSVAKASTFIHMVVDTFSKSEVYACTKGNSHAWAGAYANCAAAAYAKIWTEAYAKAYLQTGCAKSVAATKVHAEVNAEWYTIEGCDKYDDSHYHGTGSAGSSTHGSGAHVVRLPSCASASDECACAEIAFVRLPGASLPTAPTSSCNLARAHRLIHEPHSAVYAASCPVPESLFSPSPRLNIW